MLSFCNQLNAACPESPTELMAEDGKNLFDATEVLTHWIIAACDSSGFVAQQVLSPGFLQRCLVCFFVTKNLHDRSWIMTLDTDDSLLPFPALGAASNEFLVQL